MNIVVLGNPTEAAHLAQLAGPQSTLQYATPNLALEATRQSLAQAQTVFVFTPNATLLAGLKDFAQIKTVFVNGALANVHSLLVQTGPLPFNVFGLNGLNTMAQGQKPEVSIVKPEHEEALKQALQENFDKAAYLLVHDRVGMVTPRIVCMIINEAYYTLQEGTADKAAIDSAMKLGTNYPYGPFEWAGLLGLDVVYKVLEAVYADTHDERYKVCPLLKLEMQQAQMAQA